ncbi:hypothetical protein GGI02_003745 [Coemansia sp. RSA 2322]|nr:hypothetical protein GGI02_003745 [Coemansia sp. RSA 2322]
MESATLGATSDVWQQLHELRLGGRLTRAMEFLAGLAGKREAASVMSAPTLTVATLSAAAAATPEAPATGRPLAAGDAAQVFGLFASRYFLLAAVVGFTLSRIHVLVYRRRVRPVAAWARVALYVPAQVVLARAALAVCVGLDGGGGGGARWMGGAVAGAARVGRAWGVGAESSVWQAFVAACAFDCVDVFVARLEGSAWAAHESIGGVVERMALFHFYGASARMQEVALIGVCEKLLVGGVLAAVAGGWRWRLVPTGVGSALMLHHFAFSLRHPQPHAAYPFVHMLSMALLAVALAIVAITAAIRGLAAAVDRVAVAPRAQPAAASVAVYRGGAFAGPSAAPDDAALYELAPDTCLPLQPDLRRDFAVEILDLAGTCLRACGSRISRGGFARPSAAIRRPRATALDEYAADAWRAEAAGLARVLRDDDRTDAPAAASGVAAALRDTRAEALCSLAAGAWALLAAVAGAKRPQLMSQPPQSQALLLHGPRPGDGADSSDEPDSDYINNSDNASDAESAWSSDSDAASDSDAVSDSECAALVSDMLAHAAAPDAGVLTRGMSARHLRVLPFARGESEALAALIRARRAAADAPGDGALCVVCWRAARCIVLRPCRCLCLCDECRAGLALRSFSSCPCCRRAVAGYSRVYAV